MTTITVEDRRKAEDETGGMARTSTASVSGLTTFMECRRRLFGIAYRILGSAAEAEDVVQDVWLRWQLCDRATVREPTAYLATAATRIAINVLQSARVRHETSFEPRILSLADLTGDPLVDAEQGDALKCATFLLMERLTPGERAAYILRVAFEYPYPRIAAVVDTTEPAARQLVSRARKHLPIAKKGAVDRAAHERLFRAFRDAARQGDTTALERVLAVSSGSARSDVEYPT